MKEINIGKHDKDLYFVGNYWDMTIAADRCHYEDHAKDNIQ